VSYFSDVAALTRKDLLLELRAKETLPAMLLFVLSALTIFHFVVPTIPDLQGCTKDCRASIEETQRLATLGLLWTALIFTALLGLTRAFVPEREQHTMDVLVLAPGDRSAIWLAKSIAVFVCPRSASSSSRSTSRPSRRCSSRTSASAPSARSPARWRSPAARAS
jgi:ABC-type transport system involved in cytochrome c biogenesis permease component